MSRLTFLKCQDYPSRRDQLFFFSLSRFLKSRFFGRDLSLSRYLSRSSRLIETVEIYRDRWDLSRIFKISRHYRDFFKTFLRLQAQKSWQIEKSRSRNVMTLTNSRSRLRQTVEICQKCHVSTDFSISIETFGTERWCRDKIEMSRSLRLTFWNCRDFLNRQDWLFLVSRSRVLIETTSRQIETPRLNLILSPKATKVLKLGVATLFGPQEF